MGYDKWQQWCLNTNTSNISDTKTFNYDKLDIMNNDYNNTLHLYWNINYMYFNKMNNDKCKK